MNDATRSIRLLIAPSKLKWTPREVFDLGTYTGTDGNDIISPALVTPGVVADPLNSVPSGADDTILGGAGDDRLEGSGGNDTLNGGDGLDSLFGGSGNDILNGGANGDIMRGGAGDDTYYVFSTSDDAQELDQLIPAGTGGIDTVLAGISYTLGSNIENITLQGMSDIDGAGNELDNALTGNSGTNFLSGLAGNDTLDGGGGEDILAGGAGDDSYIIDSAGDVAFERSEGPATGGIDTVVTSISYRLGFGIDNATSVGTGNLSLTGNILDNLLSGTDGKNNLSGFGGRDDLMGLGGEDFLSGGTGVDRLAGDGGADRLTGGAGNDTFVFSTRAAAGDTITDFRNTTKNNDAFELDASGFGGGLTAGRLSADQFVSRADDNQAQDRNDRFIFDASDDTLWFDSNGSRNGGLKLLADLDLNVTLTASDIFLV